MLRNIDINFEKFIQYSSRLSGYHQTIVIKKDPLENTRRKIVLDKNFGLRKINSKGKGRKYDKR